MSGKETHVEHADEVIAANVFGGLKHGVIHARKLGLAIGLPLDANRQRAHPFLLGILSLPEDAFEFENKTRHFLGVDDSRGRRGGLGLAGARLAGGGFQCLFGALRQREKFDHKLL